MINFGWLNSPIFSNFDFYLKSRLRLIYSYYCIINYFKWHHSNGVLFWTIKIIDFYQIIDHTLHLSPNLLWSKYSRYKSANNDSKYYPAFLSLSLSYEANLWNSPQNLSKVFIIPWTIFTLLGSPVSFIQLFLKIWTYIYLHLFIHI